MKREPIFCGATDYDVEAAERLLKDWGIEYSISVDAADGSESRVCYLGVVLEVNPADAEAARRMLTTNGFGAGVITPTA
ncbi:MAG TPA: hypothetical protein VGS96_15565 [Thermoanaerobaculia bacterium]|jgi:hypothetical protein|nr:hypothetical protein [Thermoanaerobaculia bacterium]